MSEKAIYMPKGKAGEYAKYACNFYVGCSNDCDYCYCKRGVLGHAMGAPQATLKKCFKDYMHATDVFRKECDENIEELRKHGLFFTFTSDPCLKDTWFLTWTSVDYAVSKGVPCMILTKRADIDKIPPQWLRPEYQRLIAFGFTLTGHDELEPGASTNVDRIMKMKDLHELGFKTFASIEPIITLSESRDMIYLTRGACDLYKIGLLSGHRDYTPVQVEDFMRDVNHLVSSVFFEFGMKSRIYWKESVFEFIKKGRSELYFPDGDKVLVGADYNMFSAATSDERS